MTIGVVAASLEPRVAVLKLRGIESAAQKSGYLTYLVGWGADTSHTIAHTVQHLLDRRVDGIIFYHPVEPISEVQLLLREARVPVVYIDWAPPWARSAVLIERENALNTLVEHLALLGHRHAAFLQTEFEHEHPERKLGLYQHACAKFGIRLESSAEWRIPNGSDYERGAYEVVRRQFARLNWPTVVLANNDFRAIGAIAALTDLGLRVPEDVSVVGFDDVPISADIRPALTTIHQPGSEVGLAAFEMLSRLMKDSEAEVEPKSFRCDLRVRQTTAPVRKPSAP